MKKRKFVLCTTLAALVACAPESPAPRDFDAEARRIVASQLLIDTHIDVPFRLARRPEDVSAATANGDFDYPRALAGGLNVAFMSVYTGAELEAQGGSKELAEQLIDIVQAMAAKSPDKFAIARSTDDVQRHFEQGLMSLPLGMENGSPLEGSLANLHHFYERGIRYITLAHSLSNHLSDSSYDDNRQWNGLSEFGKEVIVEMNRLGLIVDVSHLSDDAFWQVLDISAVPVIASHSSARHFTPGFERNMSDEMITAMAARGGVIQINFGSTFISQKSRDYGDAMRKSRLQYLAANPEEDKSALYTTYPAIYAKEHGPFPYANVDDVLDHFDHVVSLTGIDYVGIGSDYDGVGDTLPTGLKDVSTYANLVAGLLRRGYSEEDIRKILGGNLMRVWRAVEAYAATTSSST